MSSYSEGFKDLLADTNKLTKLLAGSSFNNEPYSNWETNRIFISKAIDKPGTILDVGCGNGFLLKCLEEWSGYSLTPYGIDVDAAFIRQAKEYRSEYAANFKVANVYAVPYWYHLGLRLWYFKKFDYVLWNVWDNYTFEERGLDLFRYLLKKVKPDGKLILTFYAVTPGTNMAKITYLKNAGYILNVLESMPGQQAAAVLCPEHLLDMKGFTRFTHLILRIRIRSLCSLFFSFG